LGRGRGNPISCCYNALPFIDGTATEEDQLADTGTSPKRRRIWPWRIVRTLIRVLNVV
jgi:hypothetical protein